MATLFEISVTTDTILKNITRSEAIDLIKAIEQDRGELDFTIEIRDYCNQIIKEEESHAT